MSLSYISYPFFLTQAVVIFSIPFYFESYMLLKAKQILDFRRKHRNAALSINAVAPNADWKEMEQVGFNFPKKKMLLSIVCLFW